MGDDRLRVLALEPYYGGSHRAVLDGLGATVDAEWTVVTLPARKWKWRMRGAAITMADQVMQGVEAHAGARGDAPYDVIFASTFLNLAEFKGLCGPALASVPAIVYFHENQLVYPNRHTAEWDYQFPLTNITSALAADVCVFNTRWNLEEFVREIPGFLGSFPDHRPRYVAERIAEKSCVIAPPFDSEDFAGVATTRSDRCRIVWPHRWEHDKNPEEFFSAVLSLAAEGLDFEVVVAGQSFVETEKSVADVARSLGDRLVHCAQPPDRRAYAELLAGCDVAVSTANNEFFGLAMLEACYAGASPLVPNRLAYPEIYPEVYRYDGVDQLVARLRGVIQHRPEPGAARHLAAGYTFDALGESYARLLAAVANRGWSAGDFVSE